MPLKINESDLSVVRESNKEVLLGIILPDGTVRLRIAEPMCPGHLEWLSVEAGLRAVRGFSLLVKDGSVEAIFLRSRLNPGLDARLEDEWVDELIAMLPHSEPPQLLE